jgi:hypothetical protein
LAAMHESVTGELLRLIDGFYSNIEDGLFELAFRTGDEPQRRRCFDLMRELRFRRTGLVKAFARAMDRYGSLWFAADESLDAEASTGKELDQLIMRMAEKSSAHFFGVLLGRGIGGIDFDGFARAIVSTLDELIRLGDSAPARFEWTSTPPFPLPGHRDPRDSGG